MRECTRGTVTAFSEILWTQQFPHTQTSGSVIALPLLIILASQTMPDQAGHNFSALWPPERCRGYLAANIVRLTTMFRLRRCRDSGMPFKLGVFTESAGAIGRGRTNAV